jgi:threonine dehydratase
MALSGTSLFALSQQFGLASTLLSVEGSVRGLQDLSGEFLSLQHAGILSPIQYNSLRDLVLNGATSPSFSGEDIAAAVEGRILGGLVRRGELPESERERFRDMVAGRGPVTAKGVLEAHRRIRPSWLVSFLKERGVQPHGSPHHVRKTRLERFQPLEDAIGRTVFLKREDDQPVGSFKNRGATNLLVNALLSGSDPEQLHVGTASHGNHAQGVVQAAHNLGIRNVEVLLPQNASPLKIAQLKLLGAHVELFGDTFEECAEEVARRAATYQNYLFVPAFDQPLVVMGQGTVAVELSLQMAIEGREDYAVVVPAGGGGLIAGMATYLKRDGASERGDVLGAESKAHPYISRSFHLNRIVEPEEIKHIDTVADGIALLKIGEAGFRNILQYVRGVEVVPEIFIEATLAWLRRPA